MSANDWYGDPKPYWMYTYIPSIEYPYVPDMIPPYQPYTPIVPYEPPAPDGWPPLIITTTGTKVKAEADPNEKVDHPAHYTRGGLEAIDVIEAWELGFCLGNLVKYIARAGIKDPETELEDCKKAAWYLQRHIENLKKEQNG